MVQTRKEGESIICTLEDGKEIEVIMLEVQGSKIRNESDVEEAVKIACGDLV